MKQPRKEVIDQLIEEKTRNKWVKRDLETMAALTDIIQAAEVDTELHENLKREYEPYLRSIKAGTMDLWREEYKEMVNVEKYWKKGYMLRWDKETCLCKPSPINEGKKFTDGNHMYNILDQEEMDVSYEFEPIWGEPDAWGPNFMVGYIMPKMEVSTGDFYSYVVRIIRDKIGMQQEEMVEHQIPTASEREMDMVKLKDEIKEKAHELGFGVVGFTKVDRRFLGNGDDEVAPYQNIVILGMEMDHEEVEEIPNPGINTREQFVMKIYANAGEGSHELAEFIRSKGWKAHPRVSLDGEVKFAHHAVNAGVANFGTCANTITKEYGPRLRYAAVVFDADVEPDTPRDFNVEEFCSRCRMCQKSCPTKAIPKEAVRIRGAMRRRLNDKKCFASMIGIHNDCGFCIKVCPIHKFGFDRAMDAIPSYYSYNLD